MRLAVDGVIVWEIAVTNPFISNYEYNIFLSTHSEVI
jgi:hypothetical protein